MFRIIGFNDELSKAAGPAFRFAEKDYWDVAHVPAEPILRMYAIERGYLPRKGRGIHPTKCAAVYFKIDNIEPREKHHGREKETERSRITQAAE